MTETISKQRIDIAHAIYYIELKSSGSCSLFTDQSSFIYFTDLLPKLYQENGTQTLAYCLLQERIYLILRCGNNEIAQTCDHLLKDYTQYYNEQNNRSGSVFQKQRCCTLLEPAYFLSDAIKQIHYLPVSMGLVALPSIYPWSSHKHYTNESNTDDWFDKDTLLNLIGHQRSNRVRRYEQVTSQPPTCELDLAEGNNELYFALASDAYIEKILNKNQVQPHTAPTLQWLQEQICGEYNIDEKDLKLWRRHRLTGEVKGVIAAMAITFEIADINEVAVFLNDDSELLENGIRSLSCQRQIFLYKIQLKLQSKLNTPMTHNQNINVRDNNGNNASTSCSVMDS
jgi:hypothetical protein